MVRFIRMGLLLGVLLAVAQSAWIARGRTTNWQEPLRVVIYPINADHSDATDKYIQSLPRDGFEPLAVFMQEQARIYGLPLNSPVEVYVAPRVNAVPSEPPRDAGFLTIMGWSLQLRFWAWRNDGYDGPKGHARVFVKYFSPVADLRLAHSVGLREGLIGVVNAFAADDMTGSNLVVIAHELLHTFGATDKYDPVTNQPLYPQGYAAPNARPRVPQAMAEIMAGRTPLSETTAEMPRGLSDAMIGAQTAREINWVK
jgi:hypothetical protein